MAKVQRIVVMGVSGSGKSSVGRALADSLGFAFVDADDLHPESNVIKMSEGIPLTDEDRWPWLRIVGETLAAHDEGIVIACSALKRSYRDAIVAAAPGTLFVLLDGDEALLAQRIGARTDHFMPSSLLQSQLATLQTLQPDEVGFAVSIAPSVPVVVEEIVRKVAQCAS